MSLLRRIADPHGGPSAGATPQELRRSIRGTALGVGTLACCRCDAPISPGGRSLALTDALACPFCAHSGAVRDFLSLATPTRPARVVLRVR
jgi:hypothetical protein